MIRSPTFEKYLVREIKVKYASVVMRPRMFTPILTTMKIPNRVVMVSGLELIGGENIASTFRDRLQTNKAFAKTFHKVLEIRLNKSSTRVDRIFIESQSDEAIIIEERAFMDTANCPRLGAIHPATGTVRAREKESFKGAVRYIGMVETNHRFAIIGFFIDCPVGFNWVITRHAKASVILSEGGRPSNRK